MLFRVPDHALAFGFTNEPVGTHIARTLMLVDLRRVLATCPPSADVDTYRAAVVEDNVLLKKTVTTRQQSFRRLRELYALDTATLLFRALRDLWDDDVQAHPLLALLCAVARDPILRATAVSIHSLPFQSTITPTMLASIVAGVFPDRYSTHSRASIGRNVASSWQQSGHLHGKLHKVRSRAESQPAAVTYALFLGYLCDARGEGLFQTLWSTLLDASSHTLHEQALSAARRGWLEYRQAGNVTDISFRYLLREQEEGNAYERNRGFDPCV